MRVDPPSRNRITALALRTLEDALAHADHGAVKRTMGHRLALAWLAHAGIGLEWHYEAFWEEMAVVRGVSLESQERYQRITRLTGLLDHWYRSLGWEAPCCVQRGHWADLAAPGGPREKQAPRVSAKDVLPPEHAEDEQT